MNRAISLIAAGLVVAMIAAPALAQVPDGPARFHHGWYVGPSFEATTINGELAVLVGIRAGWIANHRLSLGFESFRLANNIDASRASTDGLTHAEFFYSGLNAAYAFPIAERLTVSPTLMIGGAEAHWRKDFFGKWEVDDSHTTSFVLEPGGRVEYTLLPWLQATAGAGYRFVTGGESHVFSQTEMSGPTGVIGLRFGRF